jgi:hypothetical protein
MSAVSDTDQVHDEPLEDEVEPGLPPRARRRLLNRWTGGLAVVLIAALGFIGGVLVQKGHGTSTTGNNQAAAFPGGGFRRGAGGAASAGLTVGTISDKHGPFVYVKTSDGTVVKVRTTANSKITRNATSSARRLHPGDTVVVEGATSSSGTVRATQITATAAGAGRGGFLGGGGFAGAAPGGP